MCVRTVFYFVQELELPLDYSSTLRLLCYSKNTVTGNAQLFGLCTIQLDSAFLRRQRRAQTRSGGQLEPRAFPVVAASASGAPAGTKLHLTLRHRAGPSAHSSLPSRASGIPTAAGASSAGSGAESSSAEAIGNMFGVPLDSLTKYDLRTFQLYLTCELLPSSLLSFQ